VREAHETCEGHDRVWLDDPDIAHKFLEYVASRRTSPLDILWISNPSRRREQIQHHIHMTNLPSQPFQSRFRQLAVLRLRTVRPSPLMTRAESIRQRATSGDVRATRPWFYS
jgi:hypothetical protein